MAQPLAFLHYASIDQDLSLARRRDLNPAPIFGDDQAWNLNLRGLPGDPPFGSIQTYQQLRISHRNPLAILLPSINGNEKLSSTVRKLSRILANPCLVAISLLRFKG